MKSLPQDDLKRVIEQVGDANWGLLRNKHVIVTGAYGFVGRWMCESLLAKFYHGRDMFLEKIGHQGDYNDKWPNWSRNVEKWWPSRCPDYVIHATTDGVGWQHAANICRVSRAKMLLLSSGAVYQPWSSNAVKRTFSECDFQKPHNDYSREKRLQELHCRDVAVIARMFSFIGPGLRRHTGKEFLEADPIVVNDDGAVRSYMHASDMAVWLWTILLRGRIGQAYNVGSEDAMPVVEFARKCGDESITGRYTQVVVNPGSGGTYYAPNTAIAQQDLWLRETVGIDDAIRRTLAWNRSG